MVHYGPLPDSADDAFFSVPVGYTKIVEPYFGHETREMIKAVKK